MKKRIFLLLLLFGILALASQIRPRDSTGDVPAAAAASPGAISFTLDPEMQDLANLVCDVSDPSQLLPCHALMIRDYQPPFELPAASDVACTDGSAAGYPCSNVDLLSFLPLAQMGGGSGNDIWGWTDPDTGREYALMGRTNGTAFVDVTDPVNPLYLGNLLPPAGASNSIWRDIKTRGDYAYVVADAAADHGMQVFDLRRLRNVASPPQSFTHDAHYDNFGSAHNVVINEASGYAYVVGGSQGGTLCGGGLHMVDINDPLNPTFAGCYSGDGYTHDAQCVIYSGPDADYQDRELCFNANTDTLTIVDVTSKNAPQQISRTGYSTSGYTHQGWLTEDQHYYIMDDELDEGPQNTRTYIWDVSDLDAPELISTYVADTRAIDHNLYVKGDLVFQANYRAGLRILNAQDIANGNLTEVGYFDIYPGSDSANFNGAWSNYPYFDSGTIIVSGIEQGLFVLGFTGGEKAYLPIVNSQ